MASLEMTAIFLLCGILFNAVCSFYVIGLLLRPLLITVADFFIDLARQLCGINSIVRSDSNAAE
jgi:hypothetical protein